MAIAIETYHGHEVILDLSSGQFCTTIDEDMVWASTLGDLHDKITAMEDAAKARERKSLRPVQVLMLRYTRQQGQDVWQLWSGTVCGIVAGRSYSKAIKVREDGAQGTTQMPCSVVFCVHPDDPIVPRIRTLIERYMALKKELDAVDADLECLMRNQLKRVDVPFARSKEEVLPVEVAFLRELAEVPLVQEPS